MKSYLAILIILFFSRNSYASDRTKKIFNKQLEDRNTKSEIDSYYSFSQDLNEVCRNEFEITRDGGKRFLKQCCENIIYPKYNAFLEEFGIKVSKTSALHNANSNDKRFFRCIARLDWIDPEKRKWVDNEANLEKCAEERILLEQRQEKHKPKGTAFNFTFLGFCADDYEKHACATGREYWCE